MQPDVGEQSVVRVWPVWFVPVAAVQPLVVCSAIWLLFIRFMPSMMSISPLSGQLSPFVQMEGHT